MNHLEESDSLEPKADGFVREERPPSEPKAGQSMLKKPSLPEPTPIGANTPETTGDLYPLSLKDFLERREREVPENIVTI